MTLDIQDFVAQEDGVSVEDIPPAVQDRVNQALAELTGGEDPTTGGDEGTLADLVVSKSGSGDYSTISGALTAIENGEEAAEVVFVEPGTYSESVDIDAQGLTLQSSNGPGATTIEGGVSVRSGGVTVDGFEIRNPGTQGTANPESYSGIVGVNINSGNENVSVVNNVITDLGTGDDDANPVGVLASDGTSDITVENNEISTLEGTDEDEGAVQAVQINESGTPIENVTVSDNTITDILDTRSTVAVRFNGDVSGTISDNTISDLNTEGDIPGSNDPGGFTQVISLAEGDGSVTGPSDVTITGNDISAIETTTPGNFAPPVHLLLGSSTDGSSVTVTGNSFSADSPDIETFVQDDSGTLDLGSVRSANSFSPSAQVQSSSIFPGDITLVGSDENLQDAVDDASAGDTLAVEASASDSFDAVTVDKSLSLKSIFGRPTIEANQSTGRIEVDAPDVEISGFDIDLADGTVVYVNPGDGLVFRNNTVEVSNSSPHGIRIDSAYGGETVVEGNTFENPSSSEANPQAILFSNGNGYRIENNELNGPGKGQGVLASVQGSGTTTDIDILNNDIDGWEQGVNLFENPATGNIDQASITGNSVTGVATGVLAFEQNGDGFEDINGESEEAAQETALLEANAVSSVDVVVGGSY